MWQNFFSDLRGGFWRFWCQTKVLFGYKVVDNYLCKIIDLLSCKKIGVLSDNRVLELAFTSNMLDILSSSQYEFCTSIVGFESDYLDIKRSIAFFREEKVNVIIAIGGGSVLDASKVVSYCLVNDVDPLNLRKIRVAYKKPLPLICIPTTFGSGSEVNMYAHVNDRESGVKIGIKKDFLTPMVALLDPSVAFETPAYIRYLGAVDAFVHNLEVLSLSREKSPIQEILSLKGLRVIIDNIQKFIIDIDQESAYNIALASLLGGIGIHNSRTGLIHTMAIPFAHRFGLSHSISIYPFILEIVKFNWDMLGHYFGETGCDDFIDMLIDKVLFWYPTDVHNIEIYDDDILWMASKCMEDRVIFKENPVKIDSDTLVSIYSKVFGCNKV